nr:hypothetical protein [Bradyrhizobium prioritasuperba]
MALLAIGGVVSGCAVPIALKEKDPADPAARVAPVSYRSTVAPYTSLRPATPAPWRQQNEDVTPSPKSGQ